MKFKFQLACAFMSLSAIASATEGMWLPYMLTDREAEMREMGMMISAEDIYSINNGSLKDAIVSFGGFCTGEIISDEGLVLTNHHCGYGAIQSHSSVEHNYLEDGYWAMSRDQELPNPDLHVRFVKYIEDVTTIILSGVNDEMSEAERSAKIQENIKKLIETRSAQAEYEYEVKEIYYGNQFIIVASVRYNDVRLVGAPPSSIGKFGADTDNWVWPRHTGDFSMFRIYADSENNPAEYNENNVPFKPYRSLSISLKGTQPGDFTFVYGFPGRTEEYLPAIAVEQMVEVINPMKIQIREIILETTKAYMLRDPQTKIQYSSKYASTANAWKKWIGQVEGLTRTHGVDSIKAAEAAFVEVASPEYVSALNQLNLLYAQGLSSFEKRDRFIEIAYSGNEAFKFMWGIREWIQAGGEEGSDVIAKKLEGFYKNYNPSVDSSVAHNLFNHWVISTSGDTPEFLEDKFEDGEVSMADYYTNDLFLRPSQRERVMDLLENDPEELAEEIEESEIFGLMMGAFGHYINDVMPEVRNIQAQIDALQAEYMRGQMETSSSSLYPDANSTMRITFGRVEGFEPEDGITYNTHTYLDGVIAKYVPGDYEFDLPARMLELYEDRNYGEYAAENGKLPVCFIASNHTSGGNSGSPALNGNGELIGLNFDRVWEGTMSDVYFDPSICRNIMVDIRYVLWVVDVYAGAGHLVEEMNTIQ
ncbi:MAG: S46 family peptidase [Flavobacteriia bacterium]|nr:S46 family peptidase [Flavobacteriia bacterium]